MQKLSIDVFTWDKEENILRTNATRSGLSWQAAVVTDFELIIVGKTDNEVLFMRGGTYESVVGAYESVVLRCPIVEFLPHSSWQNTFDRNGKPLKVEIALY